MNNVNNATTVYADPDGNVISKDQFDAIQKKGAQAAARTKAAADKKKAAATEKALAADTKKAADQAANTEMDQVRRRVQAALAASAPVADPPTDAPAPEPGSVD